MDNVEARALFIRTLMDKIRADHYPSTTHMDLIEQAIPPKWIPEYLDVLYEKIVDDNYPSVPMLHRIGRMMELVPRSET